MLFILFLIFLFVPLVSFSGEIEDILAKYEEASDLSEKTKNESLGHYIVVKRKDLDIMQANTLSDVLKSLKLHTYIPNRFGIYQLTSAQSPVVMNTSYRLFIDDHEVSSLHTDNPFLIFDNYPLDAIDHIEIYYGSGAVRIGNEPGLIIIKLYTKEPSRENVSLIKSYLSTKREYGLSFNDARRIGNDLSYNLFVNTQYIKQPTFDSFDASLKRDSKGNFIFLKFNYYDTALTLSFSDIKRDAFASLALDFSPSLSRLYSKDFYINLVQKFLDDRSITLNISVDMNRREGDFENSPQGFFYLNILPPPLSVYEKRDLKKYTFNISKEFILKRNTILVGASYKIKENSVVDIKADNIDLNSNVPVERVDLVTFFVENQFNLSQNSVIFTGFKFDNYRRGGGYRDINQYIARVGLSTFIRENLYFKTFISRIYVPPSFYEIEFSKDGKNLKPEEIKGVSSEIGYSSDKHSINIFAGFSVAKDMINFVPYATNIDKKLEGYYFSLDYEYKFNPNNRIAINLYKTFSNIDNKFSSSDGGFIKILNSLDKLDLYNELIYRKGFYTFGKRIPDCFNYNLAVGYRFNSSTSFKVKGENLLNSSPKSVFVIQNNGILAIPSYQKRIIFTLEKVF